MGNAHFRVLRLLAEQPDASQRQLAKALGISLGKTNYCVQALLQNGWLKANNFANNRHKCVYRYLLTPSGLEAKARLTARFLQRKPAEYEALKQEIAQLRAEVSEHPAAPER